MDVWAKPQTPLNVAWDMYGVHANETVSRNTSIQQLFHRYPLTKSFYPFHFENNYDPHPINTTMRELYWFPCVVAILYLMLCYFGPKFMQNKDAFDLRKVLMLWNLLLSIFSTYGAIRTVPHLLDRLFYLPFEQTICEPAFSSYGAGAVGFSTMLFINSKIPELIDTVFIILRKKKLIFLHWYHHVTVLLYCYNAYTTEAAAGIYFVAMNYTVHSLMYFYFFLHAANAVPKWYPTVLITTMQILQMMVGSIIVFMSIYYYLYGGKMYKPYECSNQLTNLSLGAIMYLSYLFLFLEFAFNRYIVRGSKNKKE